MVQLKSRYFINLHKASTPFVILLLMIYYENFSFASVLYLSLHGTYCLCWLCKELVFPDKSFDEELSVSSFFLGLFCISGYWIAPYHIIKTRVKPSLLVTFFAVSTNIFGNFLHFGSDAQKYFVLQVKKGLITDGFFAKCRNINYVGEVLIYVGFYSLAGYWLPFAHFAVMFIAVFIPRIKAKEQSLARYPGFAAYAKKTYSLFPKF